MNNSIENRALEFATKAHEGQLRKYTGEPYINHPISVCAIVAQVTDDKDMLAAALLHDTVEDTEVTIEDIGNEFGSRVMMLVEGLTDVSKKEDGNRKIRKSLDRDHLAGTHSDVKTIKLADLIHNTGSIVKHDKGFAKTYMNEKKQLLEVLKEGDEILYSKAKKLVDNYYARSAG